MILLIDDFDDIVASNTWRYERRCLYSFGNNFKQNVCTPGDENKYDYFMDHLSQTFTAPL